MKICIISPIGYLDRFGYQHTWQTCLQSMSDFADKVYLVASVPDVGDNGKLLEYSNVELISDNSTWFARTIDSVWFDAYKVLENVNTGLSYAFLDGKYDVVITLFINNYIPVDHCNELKSRCEDMLSSDALWSSYYRQDQLYDTIFGASVRMPYIYNLHAGLHYRYTVDAIEYRGEVNRMERGNANDCDSAAIVDVQLEMTENDLRTKMNFIRCYSDLVPKRKQVFDAGYWIDDYYVKKFREKVVTGKAADKYAVEIANLSQSNFVSRMVLGQL